MKEEWKDINGYEGLYMVSNLGKTYETIDSAAKSNGLKVTTLSTWLRGLYPNKSSLRFE